MANPWEGWTVTCDWACHVAAHNSDLGDDFACKVGTPIVAAFDGELSNGIRSEPAPYRSLYIAILQSDADPTLSFEHMHLSRFAPAGHYNEGDVIGWSGGARFALGSGQATGPHLHVNAIINGRLASIFTAFTEFASINVRPLDGAATEGNPMTQLVFTNILTAISAADTATLRGYVGGAAIPLAVGGRIIALVGDSPGTPANVQLTGSNTRGNAWAADNTGALTQDPDGVILNKGGRPYEFPEFMALLAAYSTPVGAPVGGSSSAVLDALTQINTTLLSLPKATDDYSKQPGV